MTVSPLYMYILNRAQASVFHVIFYISHKIVLFDLSRTLNTVFFGFSGFLHDERKMLDYFSRR